MFDIGWLELLLIMSISVIVIGPKDLPWVLRTLGAWVRKVKLTVYQFQEQMEDIANKTEIDRVRREFEEFEARADDVKPDIAPDQGEKDA